MNAKDVVITRQTIASSQQGKMKYMFSHLGNSPEAIESKKKKRGGKDNGIPEANTSLHL